MTTRSQANPIAMPMPQVDQDGLRAGMYGLLARLLAQPPSADLLERLASIEDRGPVADELAMAWGLLRTAALERSPGALDDEFHDLFIGIGRGELVPYASWYLTGFLMDRPLAYLRRDLNRFGIEREADNRDPEDNAAMLCESMRLIIDADDIDFAEQRRFFREHILSWMPVFFRDLQQARSACLYAAVGSLGEAFLDFEERYFELED